MCIVFVKYVYMSHLFIPFVFLFSLGLVFIFNLIFWIISYISLYIYFKFSGFYRIYNTHFNITLYIPIIYILSIRALQQHVAFLPFCSYEYCYIFYFWVLCKTSQCFFSLNSLLEVLKNEKEVCCISLHIYPFLRSSFLHVDVCL